MVRRGAAAVVGSDGVRAKPSRKAGRSIRQIWHDRQHLPRVTFGEASWIEHFDDDEPEERGWTPDRDDR